MTSYIFYSQFIFKVGKIFYISNGTLVSPLYTFSLEVNKIVDTPSQGTNREK